MTAHTVTLVFDDGRIARIQADEDDTIYLAALKHRIRIETDCLEGACATCKGVCTSGEYRMDEYSEDALSAEEAARREVLTCQMHVLSDCVIEYPYPSTFSLKAPPATRKGRVAGIETVAESVVRLVVEPEDGDHGPVEFMPGQYVHLGVPGTDAVRSYSFANPPEETGRYTFYIKVLEEGAMSDYVAGPARPGDEMPVTGPFGRFYLRPPGRPIVMVAGGTGLAPMLSMFDHMLATGATGQPIHLLYGANSPAELFSLEALQDYADRGLGLTTELCVVEGAEGWSGPTGHVTTLLRPEILNSGHCDIYLCGPPPMIDAGTAWLTGAGVDPGAIHSEKFLPS